MLQLSGNNLSKHFRIRGNCYMVLVAGGLIPLPTTISINFYTNFSLTMSNNNQS